MIDVYGTGTHKTRQELQRSGSSHGSLLQTAR
jgi:hypothetical protein